MKIIVRQATIEDLPEIQRLSRHLFAYETAFSDQYNQAWSDSKHGKEYFTKRIGQEAACVLVCAVDAKIVGYICAFSDNYPYRKQNPICEVENMFVLEQYRNKGIGAQLIGGVKKWASERGAQRLRVALLAGNHVAQDFYSAQGFKLVERVMEMDAS